MFYDMLRKSTGKAVQSIFFVFLTLPWIDINFCMKAHLGSVRRLHSCGKQSYEGE
jgi:hypothetical protein